jgi:hypothetical protein
VAGLPATSLFDFKICEYLMKRLLVILPLLLLAACGGSKHQEEKQESVAGMQLLELAFNGVSRMPLDPHIRNRARAQEKIVNTSLKLMQPEAAARYAAAIPNWRQTAAYADIAQWYARHNQSEAAASYLARAEQMLELAKDARDGRLFATGEKQQLLDSIQEWRLDRVKAHVAQAYLALGNESMAKEILADISADEAPGVLAFQASVSDPNAYEERFTALSSMAGSEHFESAKSALLGFAALYEVHYADPEKREQLRAAIDAHRTDMPRFLQIEVLTSLAQTAYDQGDPASCNEIIRQADSLLEEARFFARMYFPLKAHIVALIHQSGEPDLAVEQLDAMMRKYDAERDDIVDIYRCAIVCRIAEAYAATGRNEQAVELYLRAADESRINPNSRPRADDLNEICCSVALSGIEPSRDLLRGLNTINSELGDPW